MHNIKCVDWIIISACHVQLMQLCTHSEFENCKYKIGSSLFLCIIHKQRIQNLKRMFHDLCALSCTNGSFRISIWIWVWSKSFNLQQFWRFDLSFVFKFYLFSSSHNILNVEQKKKFAKFCLFIFIFIINDGLELFPLSLF